VLGLESAQVARAAAAVRHTRAVTNYMEQKGMVFDELPDAAKFAEKLGDDAKKFSGRVESMDGWGVKGLNGKYIPEELAGEVKGVMDMYKNPKFVEGFLDKYATVQNFWKAWTLSIFPAYHSRNAVSNLWNNFLAGMDIKAIKHYKEATRLLVSLRAPGGRKLLSKADKAILSEARDYRVIRSGLFGDELGDIMVESAKSMGGIERALNKTFNPAHNWFVKKGFAAGSMIEDHARLSHYLWAKNTKGMSKMEASESVMKYLFDYRYGITPFEKKAFRDFLMPFYTWTRFNIPLQLEMLALKPGKFSVLPKGVRALEDSAQFLEDDFGKPDPNEMFMADWMKRATKIRLRYSNEKEAYEYFVLDNWIPSAELGKLLSQEGLQNMFVGLVSPFTKLPIEIAFNYNLFQKKKIKRYKGEKKKLMGFDVDPRWFDHPARSIRLINEADKFIDGFFNSTGQTTKLEAFTRIVFGKVYPYRPEQQKKWWDYQIKRRGSELKQIRRYADERNWTDQVGVLDGLITELEDERKYFESLDTSKF